MPVVTNSSAEPRPPAAVGPAPTLSAPATASSSEPANAPEGQGAAPIDQAAAPIDHWAKPTVSSPLSYWPAGGLAQHAGLHKPGFTASYLPSRHKPEVPKQAEPVARSCEEVVKPALRFSAECPKHLELDIQSLFDKVIKESIGYGLGDKIPRTFQIKFIDRRRWATFLADRDREIAKNLPATGLRAIGLRFTRWVARLFHRWTTPIYFDKNSTGDILIVGNNFGRKFTPEKTKMLSEVLVRCLQQATYGKFFESQRMSFKHQFGDPQPDTRAYATNEALAETNMRLCLMALESNQGVVFSAKHWIPNTLAFWRQLPSAHTQILLQRLRGEKDIDAWFRRMFDKPYWAAFLLQKGGDVEVSRTLSHEDEEFIGRSREINPYGPPRIKR